MPPNRATAGFFPDGWTQGHIKGIGILGVCLSLAGCSGPEADYMAVYQMVPDAHILYLGSHRYIARDNNGGTFWVTVNEHGEVSSVERIF